MNNNIDVMGTMKFMAVFILAVSLTINTAQAEESAAEQAARVFLEQTMGLTITTVTESPFISYEIIGLPYKEVKADDSYLVWVSENAAAIYSYKDMEMWTDDEVANKTHDDAITESEAFAAISDLLSYLGLSSVQSDYQILFRDFGIDDNTLEGCIWIIDRELNLNGVSCRTRSFTCFVSAASDSILAFNYSPVIPPENTLNVQITYVAARQVALNWLMENPVLSEWMATLTGDENSGTQVIAPEKDMFADNMPLEQTEPTKTYYCWEVPFIWTEHRGDYNGVVWVNIETGEVVGAVGG